MATSAGSGLRVRSIFRPERVEELSPLQQEQLVIAGKRYDGGDYSAAERLSFEGSDASLGGAKHSFKGFLEIREVVNAFGPARVRRLPLHGRQRDHLPRGHDRGGRRRHPVRARVTGEALEEALEAVVADKPIMEANAARREGGTQARDGQEGGD